MGEAPVGASRLYVGRIGRAVGLKGEVEVAAESDAPGRFDADATLHTDDAALTVSTARTHGSRIIVSFAGISDRAEAEALRGRALFIDADQARPLEQGEYWDHDLVGCVVITTAGEPVGEVIDVLHHSANEVLVVKAGALEHLVPMIKDVIRTVEPGERITIEMIPGLLD